MGGPYGIQKEHLVTLCRVPNRLRTCPCKSNGIARIVNNRPRQPPTRLMEETMDMANVIAVLALNILVASMYLGFKWYGTQGSVWPR